MHSRIHTLHFPQSKAFLFFFLFLPSARMMESVSHEVELRSAEPEIIELLIEFIYTARYVISCASTGQFGGYSFYLEMHFSNCYFYQMWPNAVLNVYVCVYVYDLLIGFQ